MFPFFSGSTVLQKLNLILFFSVNLIWFDFDLFDWIIILLDLFLFLWLLCLTLSNSVLRGATNKVKLFSSLLFLFLLCNCSCTHTLLWSDFWTFFLPTFLKPTGVEKAAGSRNCERQQGVQELLASGADRCDEISCCLCEWNAKADTDTAVVLLAVTSSRATNQELSKCTSRERRRLLRCLVK